MLKRLLLIAALICLATAPAWAQSAQSYNCSSYNPNPAGQFCINTGSGSTWVYPGGDLSYTYGILCSPTHSDKCGAYTVRGLNGLPLNGTLADGQGWCFNFTNNDMEPCAVGGGVSHVITGAMNTGVCTPGAAWDFFTQNPLTNFSTAFTLPNGCQDGATIFYRPVNVGTSYHVSVFPGAASFSPEINGGAILDVPASSGTPTAITFEFKYDLLNNYWVIDGEQTLPAQLAPLTGVFTDSTLFGDGTAGTPLGVVQSVRVADLANLPTCSTGTNEGLYRTQDDSAVACVAGVTAAAGGSTHCALYCTASGWVRTGL